MAHFEVEAFPELEMQELEAMDAPGFWTGFNTGVTITAASLVFSGAVIAT